MILLSFSGYTFSNTLSASVRCTIQIIVYHCLQIRVMSMINHILISMTMNFLMMMFALQLSTTFQHPCMNKWRIKVRNITLWPTKNGVTSCPPWRQEIIKIELRDQKKRLSVPKADAANSESNDRARFLCKNKLRNGFLLSHNQQGKKKSSNSLSDR